MYGKIFRPTKDEVGRQFRALHNEEFCHSFKSLSVVKVMKSRL